MVYGKPLRLKKEAAEAFKTFKAVAENESGKNKKTDGDVRELRDFWDGSLAPGGSVRLVHSGIEGRLVILRFSHRSLDFGVDVAGTECRRRAVE